MINLAKDVNRSSCNYDIHTRTIIMNEISVNCTNIRCIKNTFHTLQTRKHALYNLDRNRWWINPEQSLGFRHHDILLRLGCENEHNPKRERK